RHWTYLAEDPKGDLEQGDIITVDDNLRTHLRKIHPHFSQEKYLGFLVVSQSCDLVRRDGACSAHYITLAAIRSINAVLDKLLSQYTVPTFNGIYVAERKNSASELVERILNQNEQKNGLFYLHPDIDAGIAEPSVALLRVTIAVKSDNYDLLVG